MWLSVRLFLRTEEQCHPAKMEGQKAKSNEAWYWRRKQNLKCYGLEAKRGKVTIHERDYCEENEYDNDIFRNKWKTLTHNLCAASKVKAMVSVENNLMLIWQGFGNNNFVAAPSTLTASVHFSVLYACNNPNYYYFFYLSWIIPFLAGGELRTCRAWNPVFFSLKLSRGVERDTFHILSTPTWESDGEIKTKIRSKGVEGETLWEKDKNKLYWLSSA